MFRDFRIFGLTNFRSLYRPLQYKETKPYGKSRWFRTKGSVSISDGWFQVVDTQEIRI